MGFIYTVLTAIILSLGVGSVPYAEIESAFETNDSDKIVALGKTKVLINILGKEGVYSRPQASLVLKDFFTRKPGNSFNFFFKGKESADGTFAIGSYVSRGESFRVTIHFKKLDGHFKIESLTIEKA
ncbi:MAG: DUF4783 domain-containing protein [Crocinitomicaceae bacterium]|nr:DUF4783 domain-containing protein [Crocinitomicaceae bacterium]